MSVRSTKKVVSYRRVSTERQYDDGIGLEGQAAAIDKFAQLRRYEIVEDFVDGHTGMGEDTWRNRPGLTAAIDFALRNDAIILVSSVDRLTRNSATLEDFVRQTGLTVISVKNDTSNPVVLASEAARAQREGELISKRTKDALRALKEQGMKLGNPTNLSEAQRIGAAKNRERGEQVVGRVLEALRDMDDAMVASCREIAERLNARGILTGSKKAWTVAALRRPLSQARQLLQSADQHQPETEVSAISSHPLYGRF